MHIVSCEVVNDIDGYYGPEDIVVNDPHLYDINSICYYMVKVSDIRICMYSCGGTSCHSVTLRSSSPIRREGEDEAPQNTDVPASVVILPNRLTGSWFL